MNRLQVNAFGPVQQADVKFGDLTVLVGPQATGKSLFVQLYKLIQDAPAVADHLERRGFDWTNAPDPVAAFCALYFGGGFDCIFGPNTTIYRDDRRIDPFTIAKPQARPSVETAFLIPAQRSLVVQDGWPKSFMAYEPGNPYSIRHFSECIRVFMEQMPDGAIHELMAVPELRTAVATSIYGGSTLEVERVGTRRRIVLKLRDSSSMLPYGAWSTGQREFTPLLIGLAAFASKMAGERETTVILEKPEMGLHPEAVLSVGLLVLELLAREHRVILSTHSPVLLDLVWAIRELSAVNVDTGIAALSKIFNLDKPSTRVSNIFAVALKKDYRTFFFKRTDAGVVTEDISTLDPGDENESIAGWGGLSGVSGRVGRVVGEVVRGSGYCHGLSIGA
ncbi:MAG TPA: AAA family ATPase [Polyangium sp.]|nr:AAA family ATPase [Polyangium sp.]